MCLAVPGKLIQIRSESGETSMGRVDFGGVIKEVCLSYLPEAKLGDYVMTHAGFAISRVEESEAQKVFEMLAEMDELLGFSGAPAEPEQSPLPEGESAAPPAGSASPGEKTSRRSAEVSAAEPPSRPGTGAPRREP